MICGILQITSRLWKIRSLTNTIKEKDITDRESLLFQNSGKLLVTAIVFNNIIIQEFSRGWMDGLETNKAVE